MTSEQQMLLVDLREYLAQLQVLANGVRLLANSSSMAASLEQLHDRMLARVEKLSKSLRPGCGIESDETWRLEAELPPLESEEELRAWQERGG